MSSEKIAVNYHEASETLKKLLNLKGSPVAIRFAPTKADVPAGIPTLDAVSRHCTMVNMARMEHKIFYATADRHDCNGGAWSLGLKEITPTLKNGEFYFKLGKFDSDAACKRTIERVPHLETKETYALLYAPLETTPFSPQVIVVVTTPRKMLKLAQSSLFRLGGRICAEFAGIQSVCADATAQTFLSGRPNFSLGCDGSRRYSGIGDDEMVMGFPAEMLPELAAALPIVTGAAGSK